MVVFTIKQVPTSLQHLSISGQIDLLMYDWESDIYAHDIFDTQVRPGRSRFSCTSEYVEIGTELID
jgi:hypothetical protein